MQYAAMDMFFIKVDITHSVLSFHLQFSQVVLFLMVFVKDRKKVGADDQDCDI